MTLASQVSSFFHRSPQTGERGAQHGADGQEKVALGYGYDGQAIASGHGITYAGAGARAREQAARRTTVMEEEEEDEGRPPYLHVSL